MRRCDACEDGDHVNCNLSTSCQCDCDGPDTLPYPAPDDCWHEDYEEDILIGRFTCSHCGYRWYRKVADTVGGK